MPREAEIIDLSAAAKVEPDAADWLARLDRGDLTEEEHAQFMQWLREDPRNPEEIRRLAVVWDSLDLPFEEMCAPAPVDVRPFFIAAFAKRLGQSFRPLAASFAVFVSVIGVFAFWSSRDAAPEAQMLAAYSTEIGKTQPVTLADGTVVHLNSDTLIKPVYSSGERRVELLRGEALFDVFHDADRPFLVTAAGEEIKAVGTRFSVRMESDHDIIVLVTEGIVEVIADSVGEALNGGSPSEHDTAEPLTLVEGDSVTISEERMQKQSIPEKALDARVSWTRGELVFSDEDLQSVIAEVSRYTTVEIVIEDADLRSEKISGILKIGDIDSMLRGVEISLGITAERASPDRIYLRRS